MPLASISVEPEPSRGRARARIPNARASTGSHAQLAASSLNRACAVPVSLLQAALTGASAPASHRIDGENLLPLFQQTGPLQRDTIYWHYPHYHPGGATPYSAVLAENWRIIRFHEDQHTEIDPLAEIAMIRPDLPVIAVEL